jgi:hypothetical protein
MKEVLRQNNSNVVVGAIKMQQERGDPARSMIDFLVWLEENKGLTLCSAFKPQFDWYMPALANKERLVHEFIAEQRSQVRKESIS